MVLRHFPWLTAEYWGYYTATPHPMRVRLAPQRSTPRSIMKVPNFIVPYGSDSGSVSIVGRNTHTPIYPHSVLCWPDRRIRVSLFTLAGPSRSYVLNI